MNSMDLTQASVWLPLFFFVAMGIAMLSYVVLDGYDLGIGMLLNRASDQDKDMMIASIGPFKIKPCANGNATKSKPTPNTIQVSLASQKGPMDAIIMSLS